MVEPETLIREFAAQLRDIAGWTDLPRISRVELAVGDRYGMGEEELARRLEAMFEQDPPDSKLEGAAVDVRVVSAGESFPAPGRSDWQQASGWEMLVLNLHGPAGR